MTFLTPFFLGALALVGIPLLIHLIRRRKLQVVKWAAMEFLKVSQRKQSRKLRVEEIILLLLRMIIVAIAVMAFARPVLRAIGLPLLSQNARAYAVIVLDNSFSMSAKGSDGRTSFQRGQAAALELTAKTLRDGDAISLVALSDRPETIIEAPSFDRILVRKKIEALREGDRATDYSATAQRVAALLSRSKSPIKEVYWITDDQKDAWTNSKKESAKTAWEEIGKQSRLLWVSVGGGERDRENLEVQTPVLGSELVTPQLATRISARIVNHGIRPRDKVQVNLLIDRVPKGSTIVSLPPGGSANAEFLHQFIAPGTHAGAISLNEPENADALTHDNSAPFAIRVRDRVRVLVLDPKPSANPVNSESYFLMKAMAPDDSLESLAPKLREGSGLGGVTLRDYDVIALTDLSGISPNDRNALSEYVKAGGGLILFPGPDTDAQRINSDLGVAELLPAKIGARKNFSDKDAVKLAPNTIAHPALARFKESADMNLGGALFTSYQTLEPVNDEKNLNAVKVMLRFTNGDPALVERQLGLGRVILSASGAGRSWNDLPLQSAFVPYVYQLTLYLGQGATSHRNLRLDEPLFLSLPLQDKDRQVQITSPDGKKTTLNTGLAARGVTFNFTGTTRSGLYGVAVAGSKTTDAFAVGLPAGESNLAYIDPKESAITAGVPSNAFSVVANAGELSNQVRRARYGAEVWQPLVFLVVGLLFLESLLARLFGRRG